MSSVSNKDEVEEITKLIHRPVAVKDIVAMLTHPVKKNDPPYTSACLEYNNVLVKEWNTKVLSKVCDSKGLLDSKTVDIALQIFIEGKELHGLNEVREYLPDVDDDKAAHWAKILTASSISDLKYQGTYATLQGYSYLADTLRRKLADERWEFIYKHSSDPLDWHNRGLKHSKLFTTDVQLPYGLTHEDMTDIRDKVQTLVKTPITTQR